MSWLNGMEPWQRTCQALTWEDVAVNTRTVLAIVPPQGCEAILVEILQSKRYCLLVKTRSLSLVT